MLEAEISRTTIVQDQKTKKTVLMGVATRYDDAVNFKAEYDWETLDIDGFIQDLRQNLAQAFDIPEYWVDVKADKLLKKMQEYHEFFKRQQ